MKKINIFILVSCFALGNLAFMGAPAECMSNADEEGSYYGEWDKNTRSCDRHPELENCVHCEYL